MDATAAELAELVDALDSDSSVCLKHSGSSPEFRIVERLKLLSNQSITSNNAIRQ